MAIFLVDKDNGPLKIQRFGLAFIGLFLILSCDRNEIINRPVFQFNTISAITNEGASFQGNIVALDNANWIDYGFVWKTSESPTINDSVYYF
jgi:hypothetical protein